MKNWWRDIFWSCSLYSFIKLTIDPLCTTNSVLYTALPFFSPTLTLSHCRHVTALCCLIWILFFWIKSRSYFVMPHVMHLRSTHSFFGRSCWTSFLKRDVTLSFFKCDVISWCSVLNGHHVASIASEWFWGIPFIPKAINTSLVFPKFAQYSHLASRKGVSFDGSHILWFQLFKCFFRNYSLMSTFSYINCIGLPQSKMHEV